MLIIKLQNAKIWMQRTRQYAKFFVFIVTYHEHSLLYVVVKSKHKMRTDNSKRTKTNREQTAKREKRKITTTNVRSRNNKMIVK